MQTWETLGIAPTNDVRSIKRAYSVKLKTTRPDDDAAAYQALREAYEAAQQYAQFSVAYEFHVEDHAPANELTAAEVPDIPERFEHEPLPVPQGEATVVAEVVEPKDSPAADMPPLVDANSVSHGDEADFEPPPSLDALLRVCAKVLEVDGFVALWKEWPALQAQLDGLPISESRRASEGFATFVVEQPDVPMGVLIALTLHFQWGMDYRADQHLGAQLSHALHDKLQRAHVYVALNRERDPNDAWPLALALLWDCKRVLWMRFLAVCLDAATRQLVAQSPSARLQAQGVSQEGVKAAFRATGLGFMWQAALTQLLFVLAALGLHTLANGSAHISTVLYTALGTALALVFHSGLYITYPNLALWPPSLRGKWSVRNGLLDGLTLIPVSVAALAAVFWSQGTTESPYVLLSVLVVYFTIWLLVPTDEHAWRRVFLPTFVLLAIGIHGFFPQWPHVMVASIALGWVLAAHVVLRRYVSIFEMTYASFVKLGFLRSRPMALLAFKLIVPAWALYVVACLPVFVFRLSAQPGGIYAIVAIVGGVLLSGAVSATGGAEWLLVSVLVAVFAIQLLQQAMQKLADVCLRRLAIPEIL
jgi:hypothetical protein